MRRFRLLVLMATVVAMTVISGSQLASAATVHWVNEDASSLDPPGTDCDAAGYATIQGAVDAAASGDVIRVCRGTYQENVDVRTAGLAIASTDGAAATTVNAAASGRVFSIRTSRVSLEGFTIVPAGSEDADIGVFVDAFGNSVLHNVIPGGRIGINLHCTSSGHTVAGNQIAVVTAGGVDSSAINIDTCEGTEFGSDGNSVHHNLACGGAFPHTIAAGSESDDNSIHHNLAQWISVGGTGNVVHHNTAEAINVAPGNIEHHNTIADVC